MINPKNGSIILIADLYKATERGVRIFAGYDRGVAIRKKMQLDKKDTDEHRYIIAIPSHIKTITSSFWAGLLGPSVYTLKNDFLNKYLPLTPFLDSKLKGMIDGAIEEKDHE